MRKPLSRIESEYILSSFLKERPKLTVLCNNNFITLTASQYKIRDNHIFFKTEKIKKDDDLKIYFNHKGRPLYFKTAVNERQGILFFELLPRFYKDNAEEDTSVPFVRLMSASGFNLRIGNFEDYSDYILPSAAKTGELSSFAEHIISTCSVDAENPPEKLIDVMFKILYGNQLPIFCQSIAFMDTENLLIFCSAEKAHPFSDKRPAKTEIAFTGRKIHCFSVFASSYPIQSERLKEDSCLALFSIKDMQEEDKRFLHEKEYKTKYGKP